MRINFNKFDLSENKNIRKPTPFFGDEGFSIRIYYPNKFNQSLKYRDNLFSLLKFIFEETSLEKNSNLQDVTITCELFQEKIQGSLNLTKYYKRFSDEKYPLDIEITGDFRFDFYEQQFYLDNTKINFEDLINRILALHTKNTKPIKGILLRFKYFYFQTSSFILKKLKYFIQTILKVLYGNDFDIDFKILYSETKPRKIEENSNKSKDNQFSLAGYSTNLNTIISFSIISTLIFSLTKILEIKIELIDEITGNSFFSITFGIILLFLYDRILQGTLESICFAFAKLEFNLKFKKIKF